MRTHEILDAIPEATLDPATGQVSAVATFHPHTEVIARFGATAGGSRPAASCDHFAPLRDDVPVVEVTINGRPPVLVHQPEGTDFLAWVEVWWADQIADQFTNLLHPAHAEAVGAVWAQLEDLDHEARTLVLKDVLSQLEDNPDPVTGPGEWDIELLVPLTVRVVRDSRGILAVTRTTVVTPNVSNLSEVGHDVTNIAPSIDPTSWAVLTPAEVDVVGRDITWPDAGIEA